MIFSFPPLVRSALQSVYLVIGEPCVSITKQYNFIPVTRQLCLSAEEVTIGLASQTLVGQGLRKGDDHPTCTLLWDTTLFAIYLLTWQVQEKAPGREEAAEGHVMVSSVHTTASVTSSTTQLAVSVVAPATTTTTTTTKVPPQSAALIHSVKTLYVQLDIKWRSCWELLGCIFLRCFTLPFKK